jgi:hypothetical protein
MKLSRILRAGVPLLVAMSMASPGMSQGTGGPNRISSGASTSANKARNTAAAPEATSADNMPPGATGTGMPKGTGNASASGETVPGGDRKMKEGEMKLKAPAQK